MKRSLYLLFPILFSVFAVAFVTSTSSPALACNGATYTWTKTMGAGDFSTTTMHFTMTTDYYTGRWASKPGYRVTSATLTTTIGTRTLSSVTDPESVSAGVLNGRKAQLTKVVAQQVCATTPTATATPSPAPKPSPKPTATVSANPSPPKPTTLQKAPVVTAKSPAPRRSIAPAAPSSQDLVTPKLKVPTPAAVVHPTPAPSISPKIKVPEVTPSPAPEVVPAAPAPAAANFIGPVAGSQTTNAMKPTSFNDIFGISLTVIWLVVGGLFAAIIVFLLGMFSRRDRNLY